MVSRQSVESLFVIHSHSLSLVVIHCLMGVGGGGVQSSILANFNLRCETKINSVIRRVETSEAWSVPRSNPPLDKGFVKKSPNVAPNGRVKTKAIQNNDISFILVR